MKKIAILGLLLGLSTSGLAKTEKWVLDAAHSKLGFEIDHLIISSVEGKFTDFTGEIEFDVDAPKKNVGKFKMNAVAKAASINTGNDKRDKHLKSPDFFDVKKNKEVKFVSKGLKSPDGKLFKVVGDLTMAGKTKTVEIKLKYLGSADLYDVKRIAFAGKGKIKREDFGLTWNDGDVKATNVAGKVAEATGAVGSEVTLKIKLQAKRAADL